MAEAIFALLIMAALAVLVWLGLPPGESDPYSDTDRPRNYLCPFCGDPVTATCLREEPGGCWRD